MHLFSCTFACHMGFGPYWTSKWVLILADTG
jgi:hypothetical protein